MRLISFYREHLLAQVLTMLSLVMILFLGTVIGFTIKGQNAAIKDMLKERYEMLFASLEKPINDALSTGDNDAVREHFRLLKKEIPDVDIFIYGSDQGIAIADSADVEGRTLSSLVNNDSAIEAVSLMMESGEAPVNAFEGMEGGRHYLNIFRPILNGPRCVGCHDSSQKIMGGAIVRSSLENASGFFKTTRNKGIFFGISGLGAMVALFYILFQRFVNKPIHLLLEATGKLREGDFTHKIVTQGRNEISHICARMNLVSESLRGMIKEVLTASEKLALSSTDFSRVSKGMSLGAQQTSDMVDSVTAAYEGMNLNIKSAAGLIEEASSNIAIVESSAEDMTANINEIAQNSDKARTIAHEAVSKAEDASAEVDELGKLASKINKITETIASISEQTNLLALNATIEAARAGDAGKGFAVVANEVKGLARQTTEATENIERQIDGIQKSTGLTVSRIKQISEVINDVNEIITSIAAAVDEQSDTTREIAKSVDRTSEGINNVNAMVAQSSIIADDLTVSISEVNGAAGEISNSSVNVQMSSEDLLTLTEKLRDAVGRFKV